MLDGTWLRLKVCRNCELELLRLLEEPLRELVLDADLRKPPEDPRVSQAEGSTLNRRVWWRARAPLSVAAARLRAHVGAGLLVLLGVAASVAMLVSVLGGSVIARDREVQKAVAALPESQRSFEVDAFGLPDGQDYAATDRTVRRQLASLTSQTPLRGTFFRRLRVGGGLVQLAGLRRPRAAGSAPFGPAAADLRAVALRGAPARPGGSCDLGRGRHPPGAGRHRSGPRQGSLR